MVKSLLPVIGRGGVDFVSRLARISRTRLPRVAGFVVDLPRPQQPRLEPVARDCRQASPRFPEVTVIGGFTPSSMVNLVVSVVADGVAVAHSAGKRAIVAPSIVMATVDREALRDLHLHRDPRRRDGVSKMAAVLPPPGRT